MLFCNEKRTRGDPLYDGNWRTRSMAIVKLWIDEELRPVPAVNAVFDDIRAA
jgi:hypothetical protein